MPSVRRIEPRALVRGRRTVVPVVVHGLGVSAHCAAPVSRDPRSSATTCSTGHPRVLPKPLDDVAPEPAGALAGEGRDDHLVDALVLDHLHRGRVRVGVRDLPVRLDALRAERRERGAEPRSASGCSPASGSLCGETIEERRGASAARCADAGRAAARRAPSRWRSRARSPAPSARRRPRRRARTGRSPASRRSSSRTFRFRSQPDVSCGCVETISSSIGSSARMSSTAGIGPPSNTSPCAGMPACPERRDEPVDAAPGGGAPRVPVDDVAGLRDRSPGATTTARIGPCSARRRTASRSSTPTSVSLATTRTTARVDRRLELAHTCASCSAPPRSTACFAPGTPYSYGPPTTCGISSKLNTGGGERHLPLDRHRPPRVRARRSARAPSS